MTLDLRSVLDLKACSEGARVSFRGRVLRRWEVGGLRMCLVGDESALTRVELGQVTVDEGRSYEFRNALVQTYPGRWHSVSLMTGGDALPLVEDVPISQDEAHIERTYKILSGVQRKKARREGRMEPWTHPGPVAGRSGRTGERQAMIAAALPDLTAGLREVGERGGARIERALTDGAQRLLLATAERLPFRPAEGVVGPVRQELDACGVELRAPPPDPDLAPLLALAGEYAAILCRADGPGVAGLGDFQPTHLDVQRYRPGYLGITPHRDARRFVKLVSVFSLGAAARFRTCRDRQGTPIREFDVSPGDLVLLRGPGLLGSDEPGPLHSVSGPAEGVRYSISLRMERRPAPGGGD